MLPSVTEILSDEGVGFDMSHLPQEYSERGTLIHKYAENRILGLELPEIPKDWQGFARAVDKFQDEIKPEPLMVEPTLIHEYLGIQGHPDLVARDEGSPTIFDYKTGSIPEYCGAQLAGYEILLNLLMPDVKIWDRVAVLLTEDGEYKLKYYDQPQDRATFMKSYHGYFERRGIKWEHRA